MCFHGTHHSPPLPQHLQTPPFNINLLDSPSIHTLSCFCQSKLLLKFPSSIMLTVTNPSPTSVTSPPIHSTKCARPLDDDDPTPITIPGSAPGVDHPFQQVDGNDDEDDDKDDVNGPPKKGDKKAGWQKYSSSNRLVIMLISSLIFISPWPLPEVICLMNTFCLIGLSF